MKLSTKIKISFAVLILVPLIFGFAGFFAMINFRINAINQEYHTQRANYEMLMNPLKMVSTICEEQCKQLTDAAESNPQLFYDTEWLEEMDQQLKLRYSFLIVYEQSQTIYCKNSENEELAEVLQKTELHSTKDAALYLEEYHCVVDRIEYISPDGVVGYACVVMEVGEPLPQMKTFLFEAVGAIVLALILTSAIFTIWIYRQTVRPIRKLRLATNNIKEGNLDFTMQAEGKDEFSELYRDFDAMRLQLKTDQEDKLKADTESKELISNISHDLKTPITAIKGYVEGLMDGVANTPEKQEKYIKIIYNKACEMDTLINELTFYSKIDSNRIPYNLNIIYVSDYFEDCIEEIRMDLESRDITLGYVNDICPDTRIVADLEQLHRVLQNIIGNSIKYIQRSPARISIHLQEDETKLYIALSDNGIGISENDIPHIFDRFYRSDASRNTKTGGSGIGLSIVKKIVEDHDGTISCESVENEGTTMHIVLPKYLEQKADPKALPPAEN